jgi:hypothetical protein
MTIETFEVPSFTPEQRQKFDEKLNDIIYPHEFEKNVGWTYGAPKWAVEPLVNTWRNKFDWEESRKEMARWHHLKVNIDGVRIHCVNETSQQPGAIPIMLLHGWPSTFYEFHKVIEPLRDGADGAQVSFISYYMAGKALSSLTRCRHTMLWSLACLGMDSQILRLHLDGELQSVQRHCIR